MSTLSSYAERVLAALRRHSGRANGVSASRLQNATGLHARAVRQAISELREAGQPVCAHPTHGYYLAVDQEDIEETCAFLRGRAMHSLRLEAALRRLSLPRLMGQVQLDALEDPARGRAEP